MKLLITLLTASILFTAPTTAIQPRDSGSYSGSHDGGTYVVTVTCSGNSSSTKTEYSKYQGGRFASNTAYTSSGGKTVTTTEYDGTAVASQTNSSGYLKYSTGYGSVKTTSGTSQSPVVTAYNDK